jgi:membrane dipeptidase
MKTALETRIESLILIFACIAIVSVNGQVTAQDKVTRIHEKAFTVDSHTDSPMDIYSSGFNMGEKHDAHKDGSKLDFIRMKEGGLDAAFFAVFLGQEARNPDANLKAKEEAMGILDSIYTEVGRHSDIAGLAFTPKDAYRLEKQHKRAIFIGMENGYPLGDDLSLVDTFFLRGVRYITLCHIRNNDICDSSTDSTEHHGLTPFGKQVVQRMNQLGIMVDVSHISDTSFYDVIALSKAPVIASHSDTKALCNNPRNLSDDMIRKLAANGGVLQLCLLSDYVKTMPPNPARDSARKEIVKKYGPYDKLDESTKAAFRKEYYGLNETFPPNLASVSDLVDHLDHIVALTGIDHVGIGSDFDGGGGLKDCYDVSEMKNITAELIRRGYSEKDIRKIWGGNLMRVMKEVQKAAVN